jgi:hypothetical protein
MPMTSVGGFDIVVVIVGDEVGREGVGGFDVVAVGDDVEGSMDGKGVGVSDVDAVGDVVDRESVG